MAKGTLVLAFGTFDLLHPGHHFFLKKAKELGDQLAVVIARDHTVEIVKKKKPIQNEYERLAAVKKLPYVDSVYLGNLDDKYEIVEHIKPDIICLGYDQVSYTEHLKEGLKQRGLNPTIVRFTQAHHPKKYKSSLLRKKIKF